MLRYESKGLAFLELWFDAPAPSRHDVPADVLRYRQRPDPLPGSQGGPFHTLLVDLQQAESDVFAAIHNTTRAKIRRAETQDHIDCRMLDETSETVRKEFCARYLEFASLRGLPDVDPDRLHTLADRRMLALSSASSTDLGTIVSHAYLISRGRARLLHSVTTRRYDDQTAIRQSAGRANRLLHWADMKHFRRRDIHTYDFGGWYEGHEDRERLGINKFKEEFGGRHVCEYDGVLPLTWKGKTFMTLSRMVGGRGR